MASQAWSSAHLSSAHYDCKPIIRPFYPVPAFLERTFELVHLNQEKNQSSSAILNQEVMTMLTLVRKISKLVPHPVWLIVVFGWILLIPVQTQADELSRAALLSYTCAGCHGTGGKSPGSIPSISCTSSAELVKTLESFRDGKRFSTIMGRHIKGYTKEEVKLIAGFFTTYCDAENKKK